MKKSFLWLFVLALGYYHPSWAQTIKTVGASGADYATLREAFRAINNATLTGVIELQVVSNTTEIASAVLNESGSLSASYSSVKIYPTESGLNISGAIAAPLIELNGADYVTKSYYGNNKILI